MRERRSQVPGSMILVSVAALIMADGLPLYLHTDPGFLQRIIGKAENVLGTGDLSVTPGDPQGNSLTIDLKALSDIRPGGGAPQGGSRDPADETGPAPDAARGDTNGPSGGTAESDSHRGTSTDSPPPDDNGAASLPPDDPPGPGTIGHQGGSGSGPGAGAFDDGSGHDGASSGSDNAGGASNGGGTGDGASDGNNNGSGASNGDTGGGDSASNGTDDGSGASNGGGTGDGASDGNNNGSGASNGDTGGGGTDPGGHGTGTGGNPPDPGPPDPGPPDPGPPDSEKGVSGLDGLLKGIKAVENAVRKIAENTSDLAKNASKAPAVPNIGSAAGGNVPTALQGLQKGLVPAADLASTVSASGVLAGQAATGSGGLSGATQDVSGTAQQASSAVSGTFAVVNINQNTGINSAVQSSMSIQVTTQPP